MTTIQNPALRVTANVVRFAAVTVLGLAGAALLVIAMSSTAGPSDVLSALPTWTLTTYFVALGAYITAVAVTGARENAREAEKTQFDIR
ncbi:MAG: hypothetical protein JWQ70_1446 [Aeromicrobium sp.]|jgi:hypothetical protein|nr:hypothetical protein [Aeromicrobium sp.]